MFFDKWFKKTKPKENKFSNIINNLNAIEINNLKSVFSSDMSIYEVHVIKKTIPEYIKFLKKVIDALTYELQLYPIEMSTMVYTIYLRDFYIDDDGTYVKPVAITREFITLAVTFIKLFEEKEQLLDKSFILEKNLFLVQHILSNLTILATELNNGKS